MNYYYLYRTGLEQIGWNDANVNDSRKPMGPPRPWFTFAATQFLDGIIPNDANVLEVGSGNSTLWWLKRGSSVTSLEEDLEWSKWVQDGASLAGLSHHLNMCQVESVSEVKSVFASLSSQNWSVIVIDGIEPRQDLVDSVLDACSRDTVIVWDNSEREQYSQAIERIQTAGFRKIGFFGLGPHNPYAWETAIFLRTFDPDAAHLKIPSEA